MTELALIGADPEVFLKVKNEDFFVPSIGLIGGTKEKPFPVEQGALQEDNVTAEFNINPSNNAHEFASTVLHVMNQLQDKVGAHLELAIQASAEFEDEMLYDPRANAIGCDPDMNAYTQAINSYNVNYGQSNTRYAGGHLHIGAREITKRPQEITKLVKYMDLHVGTLCAFLDKDTERAKHYGKAGNYRIKPYGVEYRTASNFWLTSLDLMVDVHMLTQRAYSLWKTGANLDVENLDLMINSKDYTSLLNIMPTATKAIMRKYQ